jgi:transposase
LRAFYERTRGRRGHGKAIVATARKLTVLFWCMLTRGEDYAHQRPALTKKKQRQLELTAGAALDATFLELEEHSEGALIATPAG